MNRTRGINRPTDRLLAEYHFFRSRKFSLFRSPAVVVAVVLSPGRTRRRGERQKRAFPPSSFPLRCDCVPSQQKQTRRAAPLLVLSFVKFTEKERKKIKRGRSLARRDSSRTFFSFLQPACRRQPSCRRLRGLCDDPHKRRGHGRSLSVET